ncbi:hypothetical protein [Pseudohongiella spirulinae]|uniref:Uncharacterized protein n=1 Tax=Pseudohongiella spirulinae TaxID=1249552 RepID=A0A0S2KCY3_9GAMM|nr:hypothetical protein [Pseudohongiella spirulinae]ALO46179.1 hypothetical protein PS2015_1523 [Pseudohongiella spirulinae]ALO46182.1 hypothetical protein PS2015_1526 [Pseudohongiella spirulinae]
MPKLNREISDQVWNSMICMALKYQTKIGRFNNRRYERKFVYLVINLCQGASILVETGAIHSWAAGFRRLHAIQEEVISQFNRIYGKTHLDL